MCDAFLFFFFSLSDTKTHWYEVKNGIPSWFIQNSQTVHNLAQAPQRHPKQNPKITPLIQIDLGSTPSSFQLTELLALCLNVRRETDYMSWHLKDERKWRVWKEKIFSFRTQNKVRRTWLALLPAPDHTNNLYNVNNRDISICCTMWLWMRTTAGQMLNLLVCRPTQRKRLISAMVCIQGKENHCFYTLNSSIYTL